MNWLKKVAELHEDYLRMVKSFGEEFLAEDIVQEMYMKCISS
jgi:DNA-directed RNA polymerase specialized sigma24 family protein